MAQAAAVGFEGIAGLERNRSEPPRSTDSWRRAHQELLALATKRAGLDFVEGRWLLRAFRTGAHRELGYGSFNEYIERLFGYSARLTQDKLRVAEALEDLPATATELENARISFSAVRELTRVAAPSTEREWLAAARGRTVREVEALVSGQRPGSRPGDAPDPSVKRHVLRLEVSGETLATFREAMAELRRAAGETLDDDSSILQLCRGVLAGSRDEGRSSYQVALTVCERCGAGTQQGRGELIAVARKIVEMAACDAQHIGHLEPSGGAHVGRTERDTRARAAQTVPPALRRSVLRRDGGRCQVPGCRHATFVDVHHLRLRSEGGANTIDNLVTLCGAHHRAMHAGRLLSSGTPSRGLAFKHADGTPYGASPVPASTELRAKTYRALVQMGFRELQAKQALAKIPANPLTGGEGAEGIAAFKALLRAALRELAPTRS